MSKHVATLKYIKG